LSKPGAIAAAIMRLHEKFSPTPRIYRLIIVIFFLDPRMAKDQTAISAKNVHGLWNKEPAISGNTLKYLFIL